MMADETEAWNGSAYADIKLPGSGRGRYVLIGLLVLFIELPLSAQLLFGNPVLGLVGIIMLIATVYLPYRGKFFKRKSSVSYVLTNKRAMVVMGTLEDQQILQQCDLNGTAVVVQNYSRKSVSRASNQGTAVAIDTEVGDVAFLKNGVKVLTFTNVPDPNNVKATADHLIDATRFSSSSSP